MGRRLVAAACCQRSRAVIWFRAGRIRQRADLRGPYPDGHAGKRWIAAMLKHEGSTMTRCREALMRATHANSGRAGRRDGCYRTNEQVLTRWARHTALFSPKRTESIFYGDNPGASERTFKANPNRVAALGG